MRHVRRGILIVVILAAALLEIQPAQAITPETKLARAINAARHRVGTRWLFRTVILDRVAENHSASMGGNYRVFSFSWGSSISDVARPGLLLYDTIRTWGRPLRRIMLDRRWNRMGVGVVRAYGFFWVTIVFRSPV